MPLVTVWKTVRSRHFNLTSPRVCMEYRDIIIPRSRMTLPSPGAIARFIKQLQAGGWLPGRLPVAYLEKQFSPVPLEANGVADALSRSSLSWIIEGGECQWIHSGAPEEGQQMYVGVCAWPNYLMQMEPAEHVSTQCKCGRQLAQEPEGVPSNYDATVEVLFSCPTCNRTFDPCDQEVAVYFSEGDEQGQMMAGGTLRRFWIEASPLVVPSHPPAPEVGFLRAVGEALDCEVNCISFLA